LPKLPIAEQDGKLQLTGAEIKRGSRHNMENAGLYAVWPYKLFGVGMKDYDIAFRTWENRPIQYGHHSCWHNDILWGAHLGLSNEARTQLARRFVLSGSGRFPAFYVNGDWIPDHDNGGVCQNTVQSMLLKEIGDKILLLPAWPDEWDCQFRLHASKKTVITAQVKKGKLVNLDVSPESRRKDVIVFSQLDQRGL